MIAALTVLCGLAWLYILSGAGLGSGMGAAAGLPLRAGAVASRDPGMAMAAMGMGGWDAGTWALVIAMWSVMMVAMMIPSAAPAILLYDRIRLQPRSRDGDRAALAPSWAFASGYLLMWLGFACLAGILQWALERAGFVSALTMGSASRWFSGGILVAAGLYQLSPLKRLCLSHCRSPGHFFTRHWRPGTIGAVRLGALHGAFCIGCCWVLMLLLFVGGVMDLGWIAALACLILLEKTLPWEPWPGRLAGMGMAAWGVAIFAA
ncbi:MAG: hypothetical protein QOH81_3362 [Sphingomonadales bacterium]|nr:hypothetical protein [Sphingomonadales bacterium]